METAIAIVLFVVVVSGLLAFTGAIKAATVIARFVFFIGVVVAVGLLLLYLLA